MTKHLQAISTIFLGVCILLASIIIGTSMRTMTRNESDFEGGQGAQMRYQFTTLASDYFVMLDTHTGDYWIKIGSDNWQVQQSPAK